ncbi:MAG: nucleotidyltransferase domain-containing protein [Geobacter sp.]|jgi:predicted nucleotidyltransferase|nr:nucleotidyltransferase domain-containing protein [Geobacter sp.]
MAMKDSDRKVALELKKRLTDAVPLVDFKVFGSRARGDARWDSDFDIFIEVETINPEIKQTIRDISWDVGFENDCVVITPLIFSRYELEKSALRASSIVQVIQEEGIPV